MIGFIEGKMERQFIHNNMKYIRIVPVSNGIAWTIERMCSQIVTAFRALNMKCDIIVWIDREGRTQPASEIFESIHGALLNSGADSDSIHILINDRMSENVILADEEIIKEECGDPHYVYNFEGRSGKSLLKQKYAALGVNYKETDHGVRLLKKIRISRSAQKSPSVSRFLDTFKSDCWWITS